MSVENDDYKRGYEFAMQYAIASIRTDMIVWRDSDDENYNGFMRGYDDGVDDAISRIRSGVMNCHITKSSDCSVCFYHFPSFEYAGKQRLIGTYPRFCPQCGCRVRK